MIKLTTILGVQTEKKSSPINEARTKMKFRSGTAEFVISLNDGKLILIPRSNGVDVLNDLDLSEEDIYSLISNRLFDKTKIKFEKDNFYRGAGYSFVIDMDWLKKKI